MQLRSRARPSQHDRPSRQRTDLQRRPGPDAPEAPEAPNGPKSAARLAAEAAFAAFETVQRPLPPAGRLPLVVVRKARGLLPAPGPGEPQAVAAAPGEAGDRSPRVFRVETARPAEPATAGEAPTDASSVDALAPVRLRRRAMVDKRPGPVLQVFSATGRYEPLLATLAGLEPVFASIRQAQSQLLTDDAHAAAWRDLSHTAGEIGKHIAAALAAA